MNTRRTVLLGLMGIAFAGVANAAEVLVTDDIVGSEVWTSDNTYNLQGQIYVAPGATLEIQPGTLVASDASENGSGSLAVCRGAQIFVNGTKDAPVIMTSKNDDFVTWREAANEWGNLTIMGDAFISNSFQTGNNCDCDAGNVSDMEGLVQEDEPAEWLQYGGGNDDDDSGSVSYLSLRYGGRVVGLADELNGISVGGVGRATEMNHIEIMNNVDDGIETWGGTVNYKYVAIWNIGDDSFDFDQGWRGKAQFGLVVQGYSLNPSGQGSGVGDNCFEHDGAEDSNAQPVTRATIYNFTAIGQPASGDGAMVWRDGCGVQYRQCIYMDIGERVVRFDNCDGDGAQGYGSPNGPYDTLTFAEVWTTPFDAVLGSGGTDCECPNPETIYMAQSQGDPSIGQGYIAEVTDSVFFRNYRDGTNSKAYYGDKGGKPCGSGDSDPDGVNDGAIAVGVLLAADGPEPEAAKSNPAKANVRVPWDVNNPDEGMPIVALERGGPVFIGDLTMLPVESLDPRAASDALQSEATAPTDGFFCPAPWRGGFSPSGNWLVGWTAADAYGFVVHPPCPADLDANGTVNTSDLLYLLGYWGTCVGDVDGDQDTDTSDLLALLGAWGPC